MNNKISTNDWFEYGIGPELLPKGHLKREVNVTEKRPNFFLDPVKVLATKDHNSLFFRTFSFVDRVNLKELNTFIKSNQKQIADFLKEVNKLEKVSQYQIVQNNEFLNLIELKPLGLTPHKSFKASMYEEIERDSMYKFNKSIDISKFYDSIYTHSIEWTHINEEVSSVLDTKIRWISGNMTNGIPTGPIVSKIFSEIILTEILLTLNKFIKDIDVHVHRFADDFTIYFNSKKDFIKTSKELAKILNQYKLSINKEKLEENYTYKKNFLKKVSAYQDDDKWNLLLDEIKIQDSKEEDILKTTRNIFLNTISGISEQKEKTTFYKWVLKTWQSSEKKNLIVKDEKLLKLLLNFSINYIVTSDMGLNTPFNFLEILNHDDVFGNIQKEYINKLLKIYKNTDSQMKKIHLLDFFIKNKVALEKPSESMLTKIIKNKEWLFLSQLLASKTIIFQDIKNLIKELSFYPINKSNIRIDSEWVVWMYADTNEFNSFEPNLKTAMRFLKKYISSFAPFNY